MDLEKEIIEIIKTNISFDGEITINSSLSKDLDIESFDKLMIVNAIEDNFSAKMTEEDLLNINCVKDLVDFVEKHSKKK